MTLDLQTRLSEAEVKRIPKIELHLHLDTSVRISTVGELGRQIGLDMPANLEEALVVPMDNTSLVEYLKKVELEVQVLQNEGAIYRATYELLQDLADENVVYAEIRFAPQLLTRAGLTQAQVIEAASRAVNAARQDIGIKSGLIMCALRHEDETASLAVVQNALQAREKGLPVVAFDMAADENLPGQPHFKAFQLAQQENLHRTCHAGEAAGAESIRFALDNFGAERIGHGVRLREDAQLLDEVKRRGIALEMCPTSNIQTKATPTIEQHPADAYLRAGLNVTINTDGRTTSHTTLTNDYMLLVHTFGWGKAEIQQTVLNSARAAFLPEAERAVLIDDLRATYDR